MSTLLRAGLLPLLMFCLFILGCGGSDAPDTQAEATDNITQNAGDSSATNSNDKAPSAPGPQREPSTELQDDPFIEQAAFVHEDDGEFSFEQFGVKVQALIQSQDFPSALKLAKKAIVTLESNPQPDFFHVVRCYRVVSYCHEMQQNFPAAEQELKNAIAIAEEKLGLDHDESIGMNKYLGEFYIEQNRFAEATKAIERFVELAEKKQHADYNFIAAMGRLQLAELYKGLEQLDQAEAHYKHAIQFSLNDETVEDSDAAVVMNDLGELYLKQGRKAEAFDQFKQALELYEKADPTQIVAAEVVEQAGKNLAAMYREAKLEPNAIAVEKRMQTIIARFPKPEFPEGASPKSP